MNLDEQVPTKQEIKGELMKLIMLVQEKSNSLIANMPNSKDAKRSSAWEEYSQMRGLAETLQEAYEKLTAA